MVSCPTCAADLDLTGLLVDELFPCPECNQDLIVQEGGTVVEAERSEDYGE